MSYPIYFQVLHPPGIAASVAVNGVPFYRAVVDHHAAPAGPFNHMLVPGKNRIHVALTEVPSTVPEHVVLSFVFRVQRESDDSRIAEVRFPELVGELEEKRRAEVERQPRQLPVQFEREFELDFEPMEPVWWNAPKEGFGAEGNAEQRAAVAALHAAYAKSDVDAFLDATSLKMAEHRRYYGPMPEMEPAAARAHVSAQLAEPWDVSPLDWSDLVFERHCEGRVAYVRRKDGGPALSASHKSDPSQGWAACPYLTRPRRADGGHEPWRVYW